MRPEAPPETAPPRDPLPTHPRGDGGGGPAARRLVTLLVGSHGDRAGATQAAIAGGLGGMFLRGAEAAAIDGPERDILRAARRRAAYEDAVAEGEIGEILDALAFEGIRPVVLKGRLLAEELWPEPSLRPAGDLDLLLAPDELDRADRALRARGFRPAPVEDPAHLRRAPTGVELGPPPGRRVAVDLHARPFRSVGHRLDPARLLARARPASLCGRAVRSLDDADRLLFLLVHAAKHGLVEPKWLIDLDLALAIAGDEVLDALVRRARATRTERPAWAALRVLGDEAEVPVPPSLLAALRPRPPWPAALARLVTSHRQGGGASSRRDLRRAWRYALEVALEPGLVARARLAAGVVERLARSARRGGASSP